MPDVDDADCWIAISDRPLHADEAMTWATIPRCGGIVTFIGKVRDHADGRQDVTALEYEAYEGPALEAMRAIAAQARLRWPTLGRIALLHRVGRLAVGDTAVVVVVSAPHRGEAFDAAEWTIDTVKEAVPIWKKEEWAAGTDWGHNATPISSLKVV